MTWMDNVDVKMLNRESENDSITTNKNAKVPSLSGGGGLIKIDLKWNQEYDKSNTLQCYP